MVRIFPGPVLPFALHWPPFQASSRARPRPTAAGAVSVQVIGYDHVLDAETHAVWSFALPEEVALYARFADMVITCTLWPRATARAVLLCCMPARLPSH